MTCRSCSSNSSSINVWLMLSLYRIVNITVMALLPIVSVILSEYWHEYWRYLSYAVSMWVSAILFTYFFGNV